MNFCLPRARPFETGAAISGSSPAVCGEPRPMLIQSGRLEILALKLKRSGIVLKIVVLAIILYAGFILVNLCGRIDDAKTTLNSYQQQASELEISNASVSYAIEHSEDESVLEQIARERLGYVYRNETIYTYE